MIKNLRFSQLFWFGVRGELVRVKGAGFVGICYSSVSVP